MGAPITTGRCLFITLVAAVLSSLRFSFAAPVPTDIGVGGVRITAPASTLLSVPSEIAYKNYYRRRAVEFLELTFSRSISHRGLYYAKLVRNVGERTWTIVELRGATISVGKTIVLEKLVSTGSKVITVLGKPTDTSESETGWGGTGSVFDYRFPSGVYIRVLVAPFHDLPVFWMGDCTITRSVPYVLR